MLFSLLKVFGIAAFAIASPVLAQINAVSGACALDIQSNVEAINANQNLFKIKVDNMSPQKGHPEYVELHYAVTNPLSTGAADTQSFNVRVTDNWKLNPNQMVASDAINIPQTNVLSWYLTYSTDRVQQCDTPIQSFKNGALSAQQEQNALNAAWRTLMPLSQSPMNIGLQQQAVRSTATGTISATPLNVNQPMTALPVRQLQPVQPAQQQQFIGSTIGRSSLPVQQAITNAVQSNDPIMKLQAVRDHYNELLTQSTDMSTKEQGRNLIGFLDNLINSANIRQQAIRQGTMQWSQPAQQQQFASTAQPVAGATTSLFAQQQPVLSSAGRQIILTQPILARNYFQPSTLPIMQAGSPAFASRGNINVGLFQSSYSSQSSVCANLNVDATVEKAAQQSYTLKLKPLENMEFIDVHMQFNNDPLQQVNVRASPADGVSASQELHVPLQLDANQQNVKYYLTAKPVGKGYQCDTPVFNFNA